MITPSKIAAIVAVLAATSALTACSNDAGSVSRQLVTAQLEADPTSFDPAIGRVFTDRVIQSLLFDTLVAADAENNLTGSLATSWDTTSPTSFTFHIRQDATCADGTPITPNVVADSLAIVADPENGSSQRALIFGPGVATVTPDASAGTVVIDLSEPYSDLPQGMSFPQSAIVCPAGLADRDGLASGTVAGAFSGPYTLDSTSPGVTYSFERRNDYKYPEREQSAPGVPPEHVSLNIVADAATTANQLTSGDLDLAQIRGENLDRFDHNPDFTVTEVIQAWDYVVFNQRAGSVFADNKALRTAVAQTLSPKAFSNTISNGRAPELKSIADASANCALVDDTALVSYDPEAAAPVLSDTSMRMVGLNLIGNGGSGNVYVQEALASAGSKVSLKNTDVADWGTILLKQTEPWDITVLGSDPLLSSSLSRVVGVPSEEGGRNVSGADLPEAEASISLALSANDNAAKCAAYESAQRTVLSDIAVVPLASEVAGVIARDGIAVSTSGGAIDYRTLRVNG